jgi:hypothetical protein
MLRNALAYVGVTADLEVLSYRASVHDHLLHGRGFLSALSDLDRLHASLVAGVRNPTRFLVLGHSHGTQFAHLLARERPSVPFVGSVLLDSVCARWDLDHALPYLALVRGESTARFGLIPPLFACKTVRVGDARADQGDVVPSNVAASIEIASGGSLWPGLGIVSDMTVNRRADGTVRGLERLVIDWESHEGVFWPGSFGFQAGAAWVAEIVGLASMRP